MLNIELIRFEAQDVITSSVATPEAPKCACDVAGCTVQYGVHTYDNGNGGLNACVDAEHTCGN